MDGGVGDMVGMDGGVGDMVGMDGGMGGIDGGMGHEMLMNANSEL
jgi:hypothetical protein